MQQPNHPDDERLAALAASEADALADSSLVAHVSGCPRCAPMVEELHTLHAALAALPDVQPSRPLRFLPPVPEPTTRVPRWLGFLRGFTAPAMAVAVLLIIVGAFGTVTSSGLGLGAGSTASRDLANARGAYGVPAAAASESSKGQSDHLSSSPSPAYQVSAGRGASGSAKASATPATASASPTHDERFQAYGSNTPSGVGGTEPLQPPFGLILGAGVVLLAVAFVARGYLRRRSLA